MGLFITLAKATAPMKTEAASAGVLDTPFGRFARLHILTIEDLFAGKKPAMPRGQFDEIGSHMTTALNWGMW